MTHQEIIDRVARGAELPSRRTAEHVTRAVLETLTQMVDEAATRKLATGLPAQTAAYIHDGSNGRRQPPSADLDAFLDRIAGRLALTRPDALRVSRKVVETLTDAAGEDAILAIRKELPSNWVGLFEKPRPTYYAPPPPPPPSPA